MPGPDWEAPWAIRKCDARCGGGRRAFRDLGSNKTVSFSTQDVPLSASWPTRSEGQSTSYRQCGQSSAPGTASVWGPWLVPWKFPWKSNTNARWFSVVLEFTFESYHSKTTSKFCEQQVFGRAARRRSTSGRGTSPGQVGTLYAARAPRRAELLPSPVLAAEHNTSRAGAAHNASVKTLDFLCKFSKIKGRLPRLLIWELFIPSLLIFYPHLVVLFFSCLFLSSPTVAKKSQQKEQS